jgi:hypothetical protein
VSKRLPKAKNAAISGAELSTRPQGVDLGAERVGIVVPTIGGRPQYLPLALASIREAGNAYVILVGNKGFDASGFLAAGLIDEYLDEPEPGLAAKINFGLRALPKNIRFFNWLGDDDLLTPGSLTLAAARMAQADRPVLVFGGCEYIDPDGKPIFTNKSGQWAVPLLRVGPQLIPQPGALYSREAFERVGGLSSEFGWAFDFNLFLSLSKVGKAVFINHTLAKFRWHPGSLSVSRRRESVSEASAVRKAHLPAWLHPISSLWEWPVQQATYWAGVRVSKKLAR